MRYAPNVLMVWPAEAAAMLGSVGTRLFPLALYVELVGSYFFKVCLVRQKYKGAEK